MGEGVMSIENKPTIQKKPGEKCNGCGFTAANKCRLFQQSTAMMETLFFNERICLFKHYPEKDEVRNAIVRAIMECVYDKDGEKVCNPLAVEIIIMEKLEGLLWHKQD
jgi:hypothetical protein